MIFIPNQIANITKNYKGIIQIIASIANPIIWSFFFYFLVVNFFILFIFLCYFLKINIDHFEIILTFSTNDIFIFQIITIIIYTKRSQIIYIIFKWKNKRQIRRTKGSIILITNIFIYISTSIAYISNYKSNKIINIQIKYISYFDNSNYGKKSKSNFVLFYLKKIVIIIVISWNKRISF